MNFEQTLGGKMNIDDRRMSTTRCAHLTAVAVANKLDESWMALQPILLSFYASQYLPSLFRSYFARFGARQAMQIRDRRGELISKESL